MRMMMIMCSFPRKIGAISHPISKQWYFNPSSCWIVAIHFTTGSRAFKSQDIRGTVYTHTAGLDTIFIQIYMNTPPGVPGVSQGSIPWYVFTLIFSPNQTNFKKPHKIKKIYQKLLFCDGFSKFVQFGLNISTPENIHSEDIMVFVFVFDISELWRA